MAPKNLNKNQITNHRFTASSFIQITSSLRYLNNQVFRKNQNLQLSDSKKNYKLELAVLYIFKYHTTLIRTIISQFEG